jgi:hypothetical protein
MSPDAITNVACSLTVKDTRSLYSTLRGGRTSLELAKLHGILDAEKIAACPNALLMISEGEVRWLRYLHGEGETSPALGDSSFFHF